MINADKERKTSIGSRRVLEEEAWLCFLEAMLYTHDHAHEVVQSTYTPIVYSTQLFLHIFGIQ